MRVYAAPAAGERMSVQHTRPAYLVDDLCALRGPTSGTVSLPVSIDWTPANRYDMSIGRRVQTMYETVLRSASSENDLIEFLDRDLLIKSWAVLRLPRFIRQAWESQHSDLN